jgi:predicted oxidoreductase
MGIRDSAELALSDWLGSAAFDRAEDANPRRSAEAYVAFAAGEMRGWLRAMGLRWFPAVGWAERGGALAGGHGNSVPRFHLTWGTGPGVLAPFIARAREAERSGRLRFAHRHRVTELTVESGRIMGVTGGVLADSAVERGASSPREVVADFAMRADATILATGGIGGNLDLVRQRWPADLGAPPARLVSGVPDHVDGLMQLAAARAGAGTINTDRMWHYCEGIENWAPIWPHHGIRILPGPSSLWLDARGDRMEAPFFPGFDTRGTLRRILSTGHSHSWFILTQKISARPGPRPPRRRRHRRGCSWLTRQCSCPARPPATRQPRVSGPRRVSPRRDR